MNIAVCDDEENVRIYIKKLIEKQGIPCRILEFASGDELLKFLSGAGQEKPDILFLDISMKNMDGMTVAKQLRSLKEDRREAVWGSLPLLIFVTGYPEYMPEAFAVHAFQYIVKPIREGEFEEVFVQAVQEYERLTTQILAEFETEKGTQTLTGAGKILVRSGSTTRNVYADDVYYIESSNRKVILYMLGEQITYYGRISNLEEELGRSFFRIHKGYLINLKYVDRYDRAEVWMKNGDNLPVSKYKYRDFVRAYLEYISEVS